MEITLKKATLSDLDECYRVEALSTPKLQYLRDVSDLYFKESVGDLTCAYVDGVLAGIGKLTQLYDGSVWLETLRVDPKYQGQGVGKAIYRRYLEEAKELHAPFARMYTGVTNQVSGGLAAYNGFTLAYRGRGMHLPIDVNAPMLQGFVQADGKRASALLAPLAESYGGFMVFNRTFYAMNDALYSALSDKGWVWENKESQSLVVLGARFQPKTALHIGVIEGDIDACLGLAQNLAKAAGAQKLSTMFVYNHPALEETLTTAGFTADATDCIVMERRF